MSERVGGVHYDVELNTRKLIDGQREVERAVGRTSASLESLGTVLNAATRAIQLYAAAMAVVKAATLADDMRLLAARVQVASGSVEDGARALTELTAISQRTSTSVAANASTFARLNQSLLQMGGTQADTLRLTELLAKAIKVSGASGVEATSAMLQFGQALGSGKLAGDELRSLLENAPYLMRQLADGLGVPIGALKKMGEEGELTADRVVNALGKAATQIAQDFEKFPKTVESAFTALTDAALRANQRFDDMTGTSARLSGVLQGLTQFIDSLSGAISGTSRESAELARQNAMQTWATATRTALSYVVDWTDLLWRNIRRIGIASEGLGTSFGLSLVRDIDGADKALDRMRTRLAEVNNEKSRGAAMRMPDLGQTDPRELARRGRVAGGFSTLTPPPAPPGGKKPTGAAFDSAGYLAGLEAQTADAWTRVGIIETEAKRKADELLAQRKISAEQHAQAVKLIEANAAQERQQIIFDEATEKLEIITKAGEEETKARQRARDLMDSILKEAMSPAERLRLEEAEKLAALDEALQADLNLRGKYELSKKALRESTAAKLKEIEDKERADKEAAQSKQLQGYGQMFDGMAGMVEAFAGKQNAAYKVLFAASKAFAIAESIIKIQQGIANAASLPFPANLGAMASVAASTASIVSTIKGTQYGGGRQYGGAVSSGSLYKVNETGRPEMFTASNGSQYMMPTASGRVTAADKVGGAGTVVQVNVTNAHPTAQVTATRNSGGGVDIAIQEVARQIRDNSGPVWSALRGSSNVQGRL